jgi:hypothetical protein
MSNPFKDEYGVNFTGAELSNIAIPNYDKHSINQKKIGNQSTNSLYEASFAIGNSKYSISNVVRLSILFFLNYK